MQIFPAIDLKDGKAVRLLRGDYDSVTVYGDDPRAVAERFAADGAKCLHLVDLDGARDGTSANFDTIALIARESGAFIEVGGGIRDEERIKRCLDAGVSRVILGTAAVRDFDFTERMAQKYGEALAVGVDVREGSVAVSGWREDAGVNGMEFCRKLRDAGVKTVIFTDISRDGAERGTNLEAYRELSKIERLSIVASGGISALDEIASLKEIGVGAAILGKALYTGRIKLPDALAAARG